MAKTFPSSSSDNLPDKLNDINVSLAQSATLAGQYKTGSNSWDQAIQSAINATTNGKVIIPTGLVITVNGTITLKANVILDLNGSVLQATSDFNVVKIVKDSKVTNGTIDTTQVSGYSSSAVYLGGTDDFSVNHQTSVDKLKIKGTIGTNGNAVKLHANVVTGSADVTFVKFSNIHIDGFTRGLYLKAETPPAGQVNYINGNMFNQITINNCSNPIYIDGNYNTPNEISGNNFRQIQIEPISGTPQQIYVSGLYNNIELFPWDTSVQSSQIAIQFATNSQFCRIEAPYPHGDHRVIDGGIGNKVVSTQTVSNSLSGDMIIPDYTYTIPNTFQAKTFGGNQDDFLAYADKRGYTITTSINPTYSAISSIFNPNPNTTVQWNNTVTPTSASPLVITINFNTNIVSPGAIGIVSRYGAFGDYTQVEVYDSTANAWKTVILKQKGVSPKIYNNILMGYVGLTQISQIRITMYDLIGTNTMIEIERVFMQAAAIGTSFLSSGGGTLYGDLKLTYWNGNGVILADRTNGHTYRLLVNNGALSVEQVT